MPATQVLRSQRWTRCQGVHARRLEALVAVVEALLRRARVDTVTGLGRAVRGASVPKHHIKKAVRLIGSERCAFYQAPVALTVGRMKRPVILIDWTDLTADRAYQTRCGGRGGGARTAARSW